MHRSGDWSIGFHSRYIDRTSFCILFSFQMKFHFSISDTLATECCIPVGDIIIIWNSVQQNRPYDTLYQIFQDKQKKSNASCVGLIINSVS